MLPRIGCLLLLIVLAGCGSAPKKTPRFYEGAALGADQVAVIKPQRGGLYSIDDKEYRYHKVEVLPGHYALKSACVTGVFPFDKRLWVELPVTVEAGKTYEIKEDFLVFVFDGLGKSPKYYVWVEEPSSGEIVAGYSPGEGSGNNKKYSSVDFKAGFDCGSMVTVPILEFNTKYIYVE